MWTSLPSRLRTQSGYSSKPSSSAAACRDPSRCGTRAASLTHFSADAWSSQVERRRDPQARPRRGPVARRLGVLATQLAGSARRGRPTRSAAPSTRGSVWSARTTSSSLAASKSAGAELVLGERRPVALGEQVQDQVAALRRSGVSGRRRGVVSAAGHGASSVDLHVAPLDRVAHEVVVRRRLGQGRQERRLGRGHVLGRERLAEVALVGRLHAVASGCRSSSGSGRR